MRSSALGLLAGIFAVLVYQTAGVAKVAWHGQQSSTGMILGRVVDDATGQPMAGVRVTRWRLGAGNPTQHEVITNERGRFLYRDVEAGVWRVVAEHPALTPRPTTLTGLLIDALGRPAPDYHVFILPDDRRWWTAGNRRIRQARPAQDGTFEFVGVPPGTYLVAAVTDVEPGDLDDPGFLDLLAGSARPVPLGAGEARVRNLQIASARD